MGKFFERTGTTLMQAAAPAIGAGSSLAGGLMGMATAGWQDRRQLKQQQALTNIAEKSSFNLMQRQYDLAYQNWLRTNYGAQVEQMKKAGLNTGLMYGGTGAGGQLMQPSSTAGMGSAAGSAGEAMQGLMVGQSMAKLAAEIENIKSDTALKDQDSATGKQEERLKRWEAEYKRLETGILEARSEADIDKAFSEAMEASARAQRELIAMGLDDKLAQTRFEQEQATLANTYLEGKAITAGIAKTEAEEALIKQNIKHVQEAIAKSIADRTLDLRKFEHQRGVELDEADTKRILAEAQKKMANTAEIRALFDTSSAARVKQWTGILSDFIPFAGGGGNTIGFKTGR
jgi:hypothetical protein